MRRALAPLLAAALLGGCLRVSFQRPATAEEAALEAEVRRYYLQVGAAFATGDAEALAGLFSPSITHPMTQAQVRDWARDFFSRFGPARFHSRAPELR